MFEGLNVKELATKYHIGKKTVNWYLDSTMRKWQNLTAKANEAEKELKRQGFEVEILHTPA